LDELLLKVQLFAVFLFKIFGCACSLGSSALSMGEHKSLGVNMRAIKLTRQFIEREPDSPSAKLLARLVVSLESESLFPIADLYRLEYDHFKLAMSLLDQWRLDQYYAGKGRLFDISMQLQERVFEAHPAKD
jgi:hypothetical protein